MYVRLSDICSQLLEFNSLLKQLSCTRNSMWRFFVIANLFAMKKTHPVAELCDYAHAQCKVECHHRTANADIHPNYMYIVTTVIILYIQIESTSE